MERQLGVNQGHEPKAAVIMYSECKEKQSEAASTGI